jgi:hypothetical protein
VNTGNGNTGNNSDNINKNYSLEDYNRDSGSVTKKKDLQYYFSQ